MKNRIVNILLFLLKSLGYEDKVFKPTTIVELSEFQRLDFRAIENLADLRMYPPELDRTYLLRSEIFEKVRKALLNDIVIIRTTGYPSRYEAGLTIYTRKNEEQ